MHAFATQLPVVMAAEKSRTAFYVVGSVLVVWAVVVSLGIGLRRSSFPSTPGLARLVMAISATLVVATGGIAVISAGTPAKSATTTGHAPPVGAAAPPPATPVRGGTSSSLSLEAAANALAYNTKHLTAKAGTITITFTNNSAVEHNVTVARPGIRVSQAGAVLGATPTFKGGSRKLTLTLQAGSYVYYCSVPGHREAGMEGTLTVT
jgi:plastocyanin